MTAPGRADAQLARQGDVVVVVAEAPGLIEVGLRGGDRTAVDETSFSLDLLDRGGDAGAYDGGCAPRGPVPASMPVSLPDPLPPSGGPEQAGLLSGVEAHVSRLGDIRVAPGCWIAGPDLPLPIEGLTLLVSRRSQDLEMQVRSEAGPDAWSPWVRPGQFAGTRQRAECLTGIRLRLDEARLPGRTITAEALFLGASVVRKEGAFVEFAGIDPLVGLKLDARMGPAATASADRAVHGRPALGRVQVYKRADNRPTTPMTI